MAVLWLAGFAAATFVEGFGKLVITKPPLYAVVDGTSRVAGFSHSYPSGHAARSASWPRRRPRSGLRLWPLFAGWVAAVVVSAELDAIHTPSDIVGGLLLATAVIFGVLAVAGALGRELGVAVAARSACPPGSRGLRTASAEPLRQPFEQAVALELRGGRRIASKGRPERSAIASRSCAPSARLSVQSRAVSGFVPSGTAW